MGGGGGGVEITKVFTWSSTAAKVPTRPSTKYCFKFLAPRADMQPHLKMLKWANRNYDLEGTEA